MKAARYVFPAVALYGALMLAPVSAPACNGNGNCENAPGHKNIREHLAQLLVPACLFLRWDMACIGS